MAFADASILESTDRDPCFNLALEEWLVRTRSTSRLQILIYRNRPCVVLGRNQNPWLECAVRDLPAMEVELVRRASGGGTVYHDPGNTNVTFVMPRHAYDIERDLSRVVAAMHQAGATLHANARHDLLIDGRKVAGMAFMLTTKTALQHWTMLINADLNRIHAALKPARPNLKTAAVRSLPSPVTNIAEHFPHVTHDCYTRSLIKVLKTEGVISEPAISIPLDRNLARADAGFREMLNRYRQKSWILGRTPPFEEHLESDSPFGRFKVGIQVRHGRIDDFSIETPALPPCVQDFLASEATAWDYGSRELVAMLGNARFRFPMHEKALACLGRMLYLPRAEL